MEFTEEDVYYADSTFFDIFSYKVLEGSTSEALDKPNSLFLLKPWPVDILMMIRHLKTP
jgi:hypothetical protein